MQTDVVDEMLVKTAPPNEQRYRSDVPIPHEGKMCSKLIKMKLFHICNDYVMLLLADLQKKVFSRTYNLRKYVDS